MKSSIVLPRNVQFIYEHALARVELESGFSAKGIEWTTTDPWTFTAELDGQKEAVLRTSAYAGHVDGQESVYAALIRPAYQGGLYNRTRSVNQYLTHWIYPYKGKFHPQMVRSLFNIVGARPPKKIFEPFCGSGTAVLEAQLLGMDVSAIDISPLCVKLTRVKTESWLHLDKIKKTAKKILQSDSPLAMEYRDHEYPDEICNFFEIAKMVSLSDAANRGRNPEERFPKNVELMLQSVTAMAHAIKTFGIKPGHTHVIQHDVRQSIPLEEKVDAIVTSPPYSVALDYVKNDEHALKAMGLDTKAMKHNFIGVAGKGTSEKLARYEKDMKLALKEISTILKIGGDFVVIIGNVTVNKEEFYTVSDFIEWARVENLVLKKQLPKIVFGLYNIMDDEKILFFRKE